MLRFFGYALAPVTEPSLYTLLNLKSLIDSTIGDIRDLESLEQTVSRVLPDIIIHMAAQPIVRNSYLDPVYTYQTNVMGTVNILECFRCSQSARVLINVTTDKCYENIERDYCYSETDRLGGFDPYSNSKACSELVTRSYCDSFFNPASVEVHGKFVATARAGNVIGGGDWANDRLIPDFIRALLNKKELKIRNPGSIRPWQHVLEPLSGYLCLAQKLYDSAKYCGAWNFGPREVDCRAVQYLLDLLSAHYNNARWTHNQDSQPHEANLLKLNISKSKEQLGWEPRWSLDKALEMTCQWYDAYMRKESIEVIMLNQINEYTKKIYEEVC